MSAPLGCMAIPGTLVRCGIPCSSDSAVTDCSERFASRSSMTLAFREAKKVPSAAAAMSDEEIFVCAVRNCPGVAAFQLAIGWPVAAEKEKYVELPSALASTRGVLVSAETCG